MANDRFPIPAKLSEYTDDPKVTNYFKQMHDKIEELNQRVSDLEGP